MKKVKGNIALTLVIVMSTILLFGGIALVLSSIDLATTSKSSGNTNIALLRSRSCTDDGIYRLKNNPNYVGSFTLTFSDGSCSCTVSGASTTKTLVVTSTVNNFNYQTTKTVDTSVNPYILSN